MSNAIGSSYIRNCIYVLTACQLPSPAASDHLGGVLEAGFGDFGAGDHSGYFVGAGAVVQDAIWVLVGRLARASLRLNAGGEGGDLREMGDAEDLLAAA